MFGAAIVGAVIGGSVYAVPYPPPPVWTTPPILFRINGTDVPRVRFPALTIHDVIGAQPNTAQLTFDRIEPNIGAHIEIGLGSFGSPNLLFAGEIQRLDETYQSKPSAKLTEWPCDLSDYAFVLNKRRPIVSYVNLSATTIAQNLIATYAPGFTSTHVQAGLPIVSIHFDGSQPLLNCLATLATSINPPARCKVDYGRDLHLFVPPESGVVPPDPLTWDNRPLNNPPIRFTVDLSQVRTRVYGKGHGEAIPVDIAAGETMLPVPDSSFYTTTGGKLIGAITDNGAQTQVMTYSGVSADAGHITTTRGVAQSPPTPTPIVQASGLSGNLAAGSYTYLMTVVNDKGDESENGSANTGSIAALPSPSSPSATPLSQPGNMEPGAYAYRCAFRTANGTTVTGSTSAGITIPTVSSPPGSWGLTQTTGGSIGVGTYYYFVTYVTAVGETPTSGGLGITVTAGNNAVQLSSLPTGTADARVTGRRIYRSINTASPPSSNLQMFLVGTLSDTSTTSFLDKTADASLSPVNPPPATAAAYVACSRGQASVSIPTSGDGRVTARAIYRTLKDTSVYRLLRVINDNTTTSIADNSNDSALTDTEPSVATADNGRMSVTMPVGPAGTASRRLYRYDGSTGYKRVGSIGDNTTTTFIDNVATASLGDALDPISHWRTTAGSTSLLVTDTAQFSEGKGWIQVGNQVIKFTGRSTSSGSGSLTGIPASGVGSIQADIPFGAAVVGYPWLKLTGGGTPQAMLRGSSVNIWIQRDDVAAQTALGLLERKPDGTPSDGIREYLIEDDRRNEASLTQLCDADLATFADPTVGVTYCCRDPHAKSGSVVHIDLQSSPAVFNPAVFNPAVFNTGTSWGFAGDYLIQSVTISIDPAPSLLPRYQVQASSVKFSFVDLLQRVLIGA